MSTMSAADRMAFIARRDAAIAAALSQVQAAAPAAVAEAGRHAQKVADTRHATLRAGGPLGIKKSALESDEEAARTRPVGMRDRLTGFVRKLARR